AAAGQLLGQIEQLRERLSALEARSANYLEHAPRNYDDYFRDTKVIHPGLMLEVELLDRAIREEIAAAPTATNPDRAYLDEAPRQALIQSWQAFRAKLDEQLGVDPEMPRLEWAAEHITGEIGGVLNSADAAADSLRDQGPGGGSTELRRMMPLIAVAAWALVLLLWFAFRAGRA
ncbi:MAG: hypothetical protein ACPGJE_06070, partial [Wenzhouxiangellaceae bacterium]